MKTSLILTILHLFTSIFIFGQEKKTQVIFDVNKNKTQIINLIIKDTLTIDGNWKEIRKIKNKFDISYHFIGFKNSNDDYIEIAVNSKSKNQFYSNSISDRELLKSSIEFESYRCKANYNSFNLLKSEEGHYYSYYVENKQILRTTLIGIIQDFYLQINYYPNSSNEPKELEKFIKIFQSIKFN